MHGKVEERLIVVGARNLHVENPEIGFRGQIDTRLRLRVGVMVPVDTKYTDRVKIVAYAILLDYELETNVTLGIIYRRRLKLEITREDKAHILREIEKVHKLMSSEKCPSRVSTGKCITS